MSKPRDKVIELVRKLSEVRVDRGATQAEAERAALHVQRLLREHQLTLLDVEAATFDDDLTEEFEELPGQVRWSWYFDLVEAVATPLDCKNFIRKELDRTTYRYRLLAAFVGFDSDVKVARFLFTYLSRQLMEMADRDGRKRGRTGARLIAYRKHYMRGAAMAVKKRLMDEKAARQQADVKCRALVVVKAPQVKVFFENKYPDMEEAELPEIADQEAAVDGVRAGRAVELKQAVEQQPESAALPEERRISLEEMK